MNDICKAALPAVRCHVGASRRTTHALAWVVAAAVLGGCAAFEGYPKRPNDPEAELADLKPQFDVAAVKQCAEAPADKMACRNRIIGAGMHAYDIRFSQFEQDLFRGTRQAGFGTTLTTLGLTTAAAASTGGAAQILSAIGALVIGGREAFQKEVLAERTVLAIHSAMRAKRAQVALRLRSGMDETVARYPLEAARGDLEEYRSAGSVLSALVGITETVGANAEKAETALREKLSFRPDAFAGKFELAVCGGEKNCPNPRIASFKRIQACWPDVGVAADTKMLDFIFQERFARARELVARCMGL